MANHPNRARKIDSEKVIADYKAAYLRANGHPIVGTLEYENGWYRRREHFGYITRFRAADMARITATLNARPAHTE